MSYFISAFLELVKFYVFFRYWGRMPLREEKIPRIITVAVLWLVYAYIYFKLGELNLMVYVIWVLSELMVSFKYNLGKLAALGIGAIGLIGMLDSLSLIGAELVNTMLKLNLEHQLIRGMASILTIIFFVLLYKYIWKKGEIGFHDIGIMNLFYIFIIGFVYTLILAIIWDGVFDWVRQSVSMKVYIIFFLFIISAYYQIGILLELAISNKKLEKKDAVNRHYLELQERQYIYLNETEQETKKFRHDMRQHIFIISQLCKSGNIKKVEDYITEIWGRLEYLSTGACVNNSIVDAIINQYTLLCGRSGIQFSVKGYLPSDCKIEFFDICTLFSNILQNAYEATLLCESKKIKLVIRYDEKNIYIKQSNTYNGILLMENGKIMTNKSDESAHGFGLENIDKCVSRYKGSFGFDRIDGEEKEVAVQIILPYGSK